MKKARILVAEDERIIAKDIQTTLEALGYEIPEVVSVAEEVVEKADELRPDLVLMDIQLSGDLDGVEAAARIRGHLQIPVVFLTAHSEDATLDRAKLTEPYGYLVKPVNERELRITIDMALHKHRAERQLAERERWFVNTLSSLGEAVVATDPQGQIRFMNTLAESITGWHRHEALGQHLDRVLILSGSEQAAPRDTNSLFRQTLHKGFVVDWSSETWLCPRKGPRTPIDYIASRIGHDSTDIEGIVVVFRDITPRKQIEQDREGLIRELRSAVNNVRTLRGMLPICASCKKIRDDKGYWEAVETYINKHSDATFSHGVCPDCLHKLCPDFAEEILAGIPPNEGGAISKDVSIE